MTAEEILKQGFDKLGISLNTTDFMQYLALLVKWNKAYNLTAVIDLDKMVTRHLLDSLTILPYIEGNRVLDVGTGAGFPGIPLALALTDRQFVLLDSNGKKTRFLQEVKRQLKLTHVEIIQSRAENYQAASGFDTITSRAVTNLADLIRFTGHLLQKNGVWVAMKGQIPETELAAIHCPFSVKSYQVPGLDEERSCVIINKN